MVRLIFSLSIGVWQREQKATEKLGTRYSINRGKLWRCIEKKLSNQCVIILMCCYTQWCNQWAHTHVHCSHQHWPSLILILGRRPKQGFVKFVCLCVSAYMSINCGANSIFRCEQIECVWVWEPNLYDCSAATKFAQKRIRKILWCTRSISEYQLIVTILCYEIIYWFLDRW